MIVGRVREVWRYPVKSMAGERVESSGVGARGLYGDRCWALRDEEVGEIRGAKISPALMLCAARYRERPAEDGAPPSADITLPDGALTATDAPDVNERLSELLGRRVTLWPLRPASDRAHYRRAMPAARLVGFLSRSRSFRRLALGAMRVAGRDRELREDFGREPGEPLPDLSALPAEIFEFTSPPGTYFDAFPIHLLTTASLDALARINPDSAWDARRFRPNFLVETAGGVEGLVESGWAGRSLRVGGLTLKCEMPTPRCGMTIQAQAGLRKDPRVLRTIVNKAGQNLGMYANVTAPGLVSAGDEVELL
ncbi:MAG: MOSC N-terminal beta barrel domain-containing protein [Acidobacteria bacterium]|nr:MOSC N-terminal beta barrel domain-containing protein [Acidobacteriota bacterium]MCA1620398.1 MOSC N-terminal beta barrel domain-containing protein [Acidobacteriota bacterium]